MTARELARRVLERVDRDRAWATPTLDGELARANLDDRDRRLASELVYGVLRHRGRIDRALAAHADLSRSPPRVVVALRVAAYQLLLLDRVPAYAAVDDAVGAARSSGGQKLAGFANAVLRKLAPGKEPALPPAGPDRVAAEFSLPRWIVDELAAVVGGDDELAARAAALAQPASLVARANRLRSSRADVMELLATAGAEVRAIDLAPEAFAVDAGLGDPSRSPSFQSGLWTVQDAGAQLVALTATPQPGQRVLDACAGVGGKATHLAELAGDRALITAADRSTTKLALGAETAKRLGLTSITPIACDLVDPNAPLGDNYDLIVLDAPCTGLGVLRRHPDAKWRLVPGDVPRLAEIQARLLDAVAKRLAPSGTLIYSVCTFTHAEGPEQARAFAARSGMQIVAEHRTWPPDADAFYLARFAFA
ncbi:MAG TPA: 16S rRNA (cytosine(967)-C(5))-methyltransferase RsmB [Kofleriaceae bacterium]|nr:16S rRNA (cytosine(967)-C(5))-methyltransferase RsmB [Kofleriaceae bacterium]